MKGLTTQQIYNKILEIQKKGNWIESPFRHIVWIPKASAIETSVYIRMSPNEAIEEADEKW